MAAGIDARRGLNHPLPHTPTILGYTVGRTIGRQAGDLLDAWTSIYILVVAQGGRGRAAASPYSVLILSLYPVRK